MGERGVWSTFEAKAGREGEVEAFLAECRAGIDREEGTTAFFVLRRQDGRYATFAVFRDEAAFQAHLHGPTATAVKARAAELFEGEMAIVGAAILDAKASGTRP